jgi:hypothetical protein
MTSPASFVHPPHMATWLVNLFAAAEETESIPGDLLEEYSQFASKSGVAFARRWYWRQTGKTIAHLIVKELQNAPWLTTAVVVGGFFLRQFTFGLPERAIFSVLKRYSVFDHHFSAYVFFASTGIEIGRLVVSMLVGCVVAWAAKGREMVATMMLGLVLSVFCGVSVLVLVARGRLPFLDTLPWQFAESVAIVVGGATVRTCRSAATTRSSDA